MPILSPNLYRVCTYCFPPLPMGTYFTMKPSSRHARMVSTSNSSSSDVMYNTGVLCLKDSHPFLSEIYCKAISFDYAIARLSRRVQDGVLFSGLRSYGGSRATMVQSSREVVIEDGRCGCWAKHGGRGIRAHFGVGSPDPNPVAGYMRGWWSLRGRPRPLIRGLA
jgi:hypothetical protein